MKINKLLKINKYHVLISALIFILFSFTILPYEAARGASVGLTQSIDTSFLYSPSDLFNIIGGYSVETRLAYVYQRFTFDLIWPIVYGLFIFITTKYLLNKLDTKYKFLIIFPLGAVLFDFLENISVSVLMLIYPIQINIVALFASFYTALKWITLSYSFIQIIILILITLIIKIKKK